jgi:hypothetical protein
MFSSSSTHSEAPANGQLILLIMMSLMDGSGFLARLLGYTRPEHSKARVVGLASKIKVVDDVARASKCLGDYRFFCDTVCSFLQPQCRCCDDIVLLRPSKS